MKHSDRCLPSVDTQTKLTPTLSAATPDPETFAGAFAAAVHEAGLSARVTLQSFDWHTLQAMRRIAPDQSRRLMHCMTLG
jgi:glycerophosphoryl diester phosphodiesterase